MPSSTSRLQSVIGLHSVSDDWLTACLRHIQQAGGRGERRINVAGRTSNDPTSNHINDVDEILYQVLHADLRDVVRGGASAPSTTETNTHNSNASVPTAVRQFHDALRKSHQDSSNYKHALPNEFRLLCQIEEVVDMAQTSERRLGAAAATATTTATNSTSFNWPNQNQHQQPAGRCLKICLHHGYKHVDSDDNGDGTNQNLLSNVIIGMETTPIRGLSLSSSSSSQATEALAGTKVLLMGPIEIRDRILLLHSGNCIVLGGCIPWFVERQQKELLAAKNKAGVGVDPTVRALIGTNPNDTMGDDEDEAADEAHESSRDCNPVPAAADVALPTRPSIFATGSRNATTTTTTTTAPQKNRSAWASISGSDRNSSNEGPSSALPRLPPPPPPSEANHTSPNSSQRQGDNTRNPYSTYSTIVSASSTSTTSSRSPIQSSNPYQQENPQHKQQSQPQTGATRPSVRPVNTSNNPHQQGGNITKKSQEFPEPMDIENLPPTRPNVSSVSPASSPAAEIASKGLIIDASKAGTSSVQNMTFENLYILLGQLVENREMYDSYRRQEDLGFRVRLVERTSINGAAFNVEKAKRDKKKDGSGKKKKKEGKTYHYCVITTFSDGNNLSSSSKLLSCKIDPVLVEPHFPVPPAELRSLSRDDKVRCDQLTKQGEANLKASLFIRRVWVAKLFPSTDDIFGPGNNTKTKEERLKDVNMPILLLQEANDGAEDH